MVIPAKSIAASHGSFLLKSNLGSCVINSRKQENDTDHNQHKYCQKSKCAKEKVFNIYFSHPRRRALEPFAGHAGEGAIRLPLGMGVPCDKSFLMTGKLQVHMKPGRSSVTDVKEANAYREQSLQNGQLFRDPQFSSYSNVARFRSRELSYFSKPQRPRCRASLVYVGLIESISRGRIVLEIPVRDELGTRRMGVTKWYAKCSVAKS